MKFGVVLPLFVFGVVVPVAHAAYLQANPYERVASLLTELKSRIEADGTAEQASYDKYACWCEDTVGRKANDINQAKEDIEGLYVLIERLAGEVSAHATEIKQLEKDVAGNKESQKEATSVRRSGNKVYEEEKTEGEQCIGALEAAIKVLAGAGTGKGFLETMKEAQLLSVVADVRGVLERPALAKKMSSQDAQLVRQFVTNPDAFANDHSRVLSAAQTRNNPFGDYAPKSTQVQGVLKGMYQTFTADLEKNNAEEANAQKAHEELMVVKRQELETLEATLGTHTLDHATKANTMAESKERLDDTKVQLAADEKLFADVKVGCQNKASEWATRTRVRTQELTGVQQAITILSDEENMKVLNRSTTSFFQFGLVAHTSEAHIGAYAKLAGLAKQFESVGLAQLAVEVKSGGHFDQIIVSIDQMIASLRKEEQGDIDHRDRCERSTGKNAIDKEDIDMAIHKANTTIERLGEDELDLQEKVSHLEDDINKTKNDIQDALDLRVGDVDNFRQAMKDDAAAIELLEEAIMALTRVYRANGIPLELLSEEPNATYNEDAPPETSWREPYAVRRGEGHGVITILQMLKEDTEQEMLRARKDDARAQAQYDRERAAMRQALNSQVTLQTATEKELASVEAQIQDATETKGMREDDLVANGDRKSVLEEDCGWIESHFASRRDKRQTEIQGLIDAKGYLAGAADLS